MSIRRIFSLFLALLMTFSTFAGIIPANAFASENTQTAEAAESTEEKSNDVIASYEIPLEDVTFGADGSMHLNLADYEPISTEPVVTEPVVTEPVVTEPVVTEPVVTEPVVTEPVVTEPVVTEPMVTEPVVTEPVVTEPVVTEPVVTEPVVTEPVVTEPEATEAEAVPELLTWFQWIQEKGLDTSGMSKEEINALSAEYGVYRINALTEMGELAEGAAYGTVANNYIEVAVGEDGRFTIGNRIGNPNYSSDDNQILLYGHPSPRTSETLIYIDGEYQNYFYADTTSYQYNTAISTMNIPSYGIKVEQTLKLIKLGSSSFEDTVQIQYKVINTDSRSHNVGIRIMMDTMLADNDHATYHLASKGHITDSRVFTGSAIPSQYQFYDNIQNPTTIATGHLYRSGDRKPDKVQFCNWGGIMSSKWNHSVSDGDTLGDSAVGIYFDPKEVKSGKDFTVRTYYGVSLGTSASDSTEVNSGEVKMIVKDGYTGAPLEGVTVTYNQGLNTTFSTALTDESGVAILSPFSTIQSVSTMVTLSKEGYKTSSFRTNLRGGSTQTYTLNLEDAKKPVINTVVLKKGNTTVNLLDSTFTVDEDPNDFIGKNGATGTITIEATSDMANCTWTLFQDEKVVQRNQDGKFIFNVREITDEDGNKKIFIEEFASQGNRYIQCVSPEGEKSEKMRFGLNVRAGTKVSFGDFDLGKVWPKVDGSIAEGSLGALFLGNKLQFGPNGGKYKVFAELTEDGKVRVGLNVDVKELAKANEIDENGKPVYKERKEDFLESLRQEMLDYSTGKNKKLKNTIAKPGKFSYGVGTADLVFCGYGEGFLENGSVRVDVTVFFAIKAEGSYTWQFLWGAVPVYIDVGGEASAKLQASANIVNTEGLGFRFYDAVFNPSIKVWLEGGFGVKKAVSVGVQGSGSVLADWDLLDQSVVVKLKASAALVAEAFGIFEKDLTFAEKTVTVYDSKAKEGTVFGGDNVLAQLAAQPYRLISRGESADGGTSQATTNARIVTVNGQQYKFFAIDRGGQLSNRYMLCWSRLENGSWTDAVAVYNDGTTDLYYDVAVSGSDIYVVWSNSGRTFVDDGLTVDEFAQAQEICMAVIDTTDGNSEIIELTDDSIMDSMPAVTVLDGTAYVAWYHTENSMLEDAVDTHDNYLYYTAVTGTAKGETVSVNFENAAINSVSASAASGKPLATVVTNASEAYENEEGQTTSTLLPNETAVVDLSNGTKTDVDTTDKVIGKTVNGVIDGVEKTFWMENGNVAYADSITSENPSYVFAADTIPGSITADNYTVISVGGSTYLIWSQSSNQENVPASAMTTIYSNGVWSSVHKLTDLTTGNITKLDGYMNADGQLVLVYNVKTIGENVNGQATINNASYEKVVEPEKSVSIANLDFNITEAIPGQVLPLKLDVTNTGNTAIDSLDVTINSEAGENYTKTLIGLNIAPGTSQTVEITDFILSDTLTTRTTVQGQYLYTLTAKASDSEIIAEETFELGYDNVVIYKRDMAYVDNKENVVIAVENMSGFTASNVRVQILADAVDGVLIYDHTFEEIAANDVKTIYLAVEELDSSSLFATASSDCTAAEPAEYVELILENLNTMANLTMEALGCGSVDPAGEALYEIGEAVSITATADEGYLFDGWYSNRELVYQQGSEDTAEATIEMPAGDTVITARFVSETPYDFTLSAQSLEMKAGQQSQLVANFDSPETTGKVLWSSSNESVATVSGRGVVTALAAGTAEITAACGENVHTCQVTVSYVDVTSIRMVYPSVNMTPGETAATELLTDPAEGISSLQWSSSNESVATVDAQGNVTAVGYGEAVITATAFTNSAVTGSYTVNVIQPVEDIALNQYEINLTLVDNQAELLVSYLPENANYGQQITWSVDNEGVLDLVPSGEYNEHLSITARRWGDVIVTATSENGHQVSCAVTVRDIVYAESVEELNCYPYEQDMNRTWIYEDATKDALLVRFSEDTDIHYDDELQLLDSAGNLIASSRETGFGGKTFLVRDSGLQLHLLSDSDDYGDFGFRVESISGKVSAADIEIATNNVAYTGKTLKPAFKVYFQGHQKLTSGKDYTLSYSSNKNIGTATVKFTGKGLFEGITVKRTFRIVPGNTTLKATVTSSGIKLSWAASKGAGGYLLYRNVNNSYNENGKEWKLLKKLSSSTKTYTDTNTSSSKAYSYKLVPYKNVTVNKKTTRYDAKYSEFGPITRLGPVKNLTGTNDFKNNAIKLKWSALSGADGYIVYRSENGYAYTIATYTTETQYVAGVYSDAKYQFKVVPYKYIEIDGYRAQYHGAASSVYTAYRLATPSLDCWRNGKQVNLWYSYVYSKDQTGVQIYRSSDGGKTWKLAKTIKCGSKQPGSYHSGNLTDKDAKSIGTTYMYKARSYVTVDKKNYYSSWSEINTTLGRPTVSSVKTSSKGGLNVSWKKIHGAQWYEIRRSYSDENGHWSDETSIYRPTDSKATSYTFRDKDAVNYGHYEYAITAFMTDSYDNTYSSSESEWKAGLVLRSPNMTYLANADKGVEMSWDWDSWVDGYQIYRSTNGGAYTKVKTIRDVYWNDTTATKNKATYSYKIRAYGKVDGTTYYSSFCSPQSVSKMTPPKVKSLKVRTDGGFSLTFYGVKDAASYRILRWDGENYENAAWSKEIKNTGKSTYTISDPGATAENTLYNYEIIALRNEKNGQTTFATSYAYGYHFGKPEVTAENTEKGIRIYAYVPDAYVPDRSHADSYIIYRSVNGGSYAKLKTVNADMWGRMSYNDTTAVAGKTYSYKIKAVGNWLNAYTYRTSSATPALKCAPGPALSGLYNSSTGGITVKWKTQSGMPTAAGYEIYRSQDGFNYEQIDSVDKDTFSYKDTTATFKTNEYVEANIYYYKVKAVPAVQGKPETWSKPQKIVYMPVPVVYGVYDAGTKAYVEFNAYGFRDGFEIRYKTGSTTKTVKNTNALSGLSATKTYEISMRTYLKYDGKTYYSAWSTPYILRGNS